MPGAGAAGLTDCPSDGKPEEEGKTKGSAEAGML
jgi:hypothetical protein